MRGTAIYARWQAMGGTAGTLGAPTSPETPGAGSARYVTFDRGAVYWSPSTGAAPVRGAIYDAWATLGFERGALGCPTTVVPGSAVVGRPSAPRSKPSVAQAS